ncbi:MAG TPA: hypothetical protein VFE65_15185 [Pseudonocardia sp.]|jgi:hypothetical protein|nr:hypothetical protein [Pseudonocardia sp.]
MPSESDADYQSNPVERTEEPTRPRQVDSAFLFWVAAVVLMLLGILFALPDEELLEQMVAETAASQGIPIEPALAAEMMGTLRVIVVAGAVIGAAVWLLFAFKMRNGRSWARILLAVFGGLHVVLMLTRLVQGPGFGTPAMVLVLLAVLSVVEIAAIVMMFRPATAWYFRTD